MKTKKLLSIIIVLAMVVSLLPVTVSAETGGKYIARSWDETKKQVVSTAKDIPTYAGEITADTTELSGGWYVVRKTVTNGNRIVVKGTTNNPTNIVLLDGFTLTAAAGIEVAEGYTLNIYGQQKNIGVIEAHCDSYPNEYSAAIGAGDHNTNTGTVNIFGGTIVAASKYGAGIGDDGYNDDFISAGAVTVYGGTIVATSTYGAGIGGGHWGSGSKVTVYGGTVTATSARNSGIGAGNHIGEGEFTVANGLEIRAGDTADDSKPVTVEDYRKYRYHYVSIIYPPHSHNFTGDCVNNGDGTHAYKCTGCEEFGTPEAHTYEDGVCACGAHNLGKYIARSWDSDKKQVVSTEEDIPETAQKITADTRELESGWYVLSESVTLPEGKHITVNGDVNLVLCDDCELKIPSPGNVHAAIELTDGGTFGASDSLTIYGQKNDTGSIVAYGGSSAAGIGSYDKEDSGTLTINGGIVTAYGGNDGAGIGGGHERDCGDITIYGGTVTATGGNLGAGIGNGYEGNGGSITVYGGTVKAYGNGSMALGGGSRGIYRNKISIYGGDIIADSKSTKDAVIAYSVKVYANADKKFTVKDLSGTELSVSPVTEEKDLYNSLSGYKAIHIADGTLPAVKYWMSGNAYAECKSYTPVMQDTTTWTGGADEENAGWYVVNENITIDGDISLSGTVCLILCDGKTLTVNGNITSEGGHIKVYAQSDGSTKGCLNVDSFDSWRLDISILGGNITAGFIKCCHLEISNGALTVSGVVPTGFSIYSIIVDDGMHVSGGTVTVNNVANVHEVIIINDGDLSIKGGTVTVTGGYNGIYAKFHTITISENANVTVTTEGEVGILANHLEVTGGNLSVTGSKYGIQTKTSKFSNSTGILRPANVTVQGGEKAFSVSDPNGIEIYYNGRDTVKVYNRANEEVVRQVGGLYWAQILTDTYYRLVAESSVVPYLYYDEVSKELKQSVCLDYEVIDENHKPTEWEAGKWYVVKDGVGITGNVSVSGDVHLILTDESTLMIQTNENPIFIKDTISGEDAHLYLHSQSTGSKAGQLNCYGPNGPEKVEGGNAITVSALTIIGVSVSVKGGNGGYGKSLKGGNAIDVSILTVNNATVTAVGGVGGKGFSAGASWGTAHSGGDGGSGIKCLSLVINEGSVNATGGNGGAGGKDNEGGYRSDGATGASVILNEGGVIDGTVQVRANETDEFIPLPSGKSVSDYRFAKITKTFVPDSLTLDISGNDFKVTPNGEDTNKGVVIVALYDSEYMTRLLDVKTFDLTKTDKPEGKFTQSGYVKAFWWSSLSDITPLCKAKGED